MKKYEEQIIEIAKKVYSTLGEGYEERVYAKAMAIDFRRDKIPYTVEHHIEAFYRGECVGTQRLDFIVDDTIAVELKSVANISNLNRSQTKAYLRTSGFTSGLIINFATHSKEEPEIEVLSNEAKEAA